MYLLGRFHHRQVVTGGQFFKQRKAAWDSLFLLLDWLSNCWVSPTFLHTMN